MLAKIWKKVLLAVCIIACIFNLMSKLVNRHSLKENLESVDDGTTVFNIFQKKDKDVKVVESDTIDGVINVTNNENTTSTYIVNTSDNNEVIDSEENTSEDVTEETTTDIQNAETEESEVDDQTVTFKVNSFFNFF